ncbi:MAG: terpene cyclase/mutase family protein [Planctomycetaceae bacterium]|nr:terpene cyclase/mutase family protein [Planctomycetaceae bacterium]
MLQQVRQRQNLRRRRSRPPEWLIRLAAGSRRFRTLIGTRFPQWLIQHREELTMAVLSFLMHLCIALLMAWWVLPPDTTDSLFSLLVTNETDADEPDLVVDVEQILQTETLKDLSVNSSLKQMLSDLNEDVAAENLPSEVEREFAVDLEPTNAEMESLFRQGEFGGRTASGKQAALKKYGGTAESERAVNAGLKWLQSIQRKNGSWSFADVGPEAEPGRFARAEAGATSLSLLCFLAAGHTHRRDGPYRDTVMNGLKFLGSQAEVSRNTADFRGGSEGNSPMYVHALASLCLSEAHAMEPDDDELTQATRMAVDFIERSQDSSGGGWRYRPGQAGDTSVTGWQIMALQSAKAGGIRVSSTTLRKARQFLQSVQTEKDGSAYSYVPDQRAKISMTAVALLCRMYFGWKQDHEGLQKGVARLSAAGPHRSDIYFNYYATQVLHHWGGDQWKKWNQELREQLVRTQVTDGPAAGTWPPADPHADAGGTLYQTTLSILTLEVYYRHLPLYYEPQSGPDE